MPQARRARFRGGSLARHRRHCDAAGGPGVSCGRRVAYWRGRVDTWRRHGLADAASLGFLCDNVEGFTLVTADGSVVRANARENADLFWALRGGGGNFGVVIDFELRVASADVGAAGEFVLCWR